ncbi:unnamed protein product [Eruca vesicaria subsp. sativa]|uniref:beta-ketoacyl-[acyl-carrier-protein] synthase I n=1 Tax=Eruca vesicaria subsp. sativa TaxID=29727 RepID=A0ABC8K4B8_ERUVS|nr:unnamed protein product [Eruca vesicaria subsp. sativa]
MRPIRRQSFVSASATVSTPKHETDPKKRVVITGMGLISVFGEIDVRVESALLIDASKFPIRFGDQIYGFISKGYINEKNERRLDDYLKYCIVTGKNALKSENLGLGKLNMVLY